MTIKRIFTTFIKKIRKKIRIATGCQKSDIYIINEKLDLIKKDVNVIKSISLNVRERSNDANIIVNSLKNAVFNRQINDKIKFMFNTFIYEHYNTNEIYNYWRRNLENCIQSKIKNEIVFITDKNYIYPTAVAISSIIFNCCNTKEEGYNIHVIATDDVDKSFFRIFDTFNSAVSIDYIDYNIIGIEKRGGYVTKTSLFKFIIPEIYKRIDKILYLDSDVVVEGDISELFKVNIDEVYAGVVKDYAGMVLQSLHLEMNHKNYFNSGVMLLNLKNMRKDNISKKLIESKKHPKYKDFFSDQATLNYVFNENVKYLHPKYNFMYANNIQIDNYIFQSKYVFDIDYNEYLKTNDNPVILHLTNKIKPWNCSDSFGYEYFRKEEEVLKVAMRHAYNKC